MNVLVCVKPTAAGDLNPFDGAALEAALRIDGATVSLLSMAPPKTEELLRSLTRLGASEAFLLSDPAFAGADTLATAYTLSLAVKKLSPDLILCGRQTVDGDTGQTGPGLATAAGYALIANAMELHPEETQITCRTRKEGSVSAPYPALVTVERIHTLRPPSIFSKEGSVTVWNADDLNADRSRCGLAGSPTRVLKSFPNEGGKRKCVFYPPEEFDALLRAALKKQPESSAVSNPCLTPLKNVWIVGEAPRAMAQTVSDDIHVIPPAPAEQIAEQVRKECPSALFWGSDPWSKRTAPAVAWLLQTGLCADCTELETDGSDLIFYRPALAGNVVAKIRCTTRPAMATVRTEDREEQKLLFAFGKGAKDALPGVRSFAARYGAGIVASRGAVDTDLLPYELQVGLTGRTVSPAVYVAFGISGAVHHVVGMQRSGTVIAVNTDPNAPIFEYADYGIIADIKTLTGD